MEFEFDKEIDAILRRARTVETVAPADSHLDADEIAAFAENALTDAARRRYTAHFADCARCRKILSNSVLMNTEADVETASSALAAQIAEAETPWYRRFFVFPQLAYAMGAMVLLFSGFFGYLILQNLSGSKYADVSRSTEDRREMTESAPQPAANAAANSNATTTATNSITTTTATNSASTVANSTNPSAPISSSNTAALATPAPPLPATEKKPAEENLPAPSLSQPMIVPQATPSDKMNEADDDKNKDLATADALRKEEKRDESENQSKLSANTTGGATSSERLQRQRANTPSPKKKVSEAGATRTVGGKTFNNVGGIWFDSAVGKQPQTTVRRGTSEYLRLDGGLRSIADQLGGTVVILWSGKAYRIQ